MGEFMSSCCWLGDLLQQHFPCASKSGFLRLKSPSLLLCLQKYWLLPLTLNSHHTRLRNQFFSDFWWGKNQPIVGQSWWYGEWKASLFLSVEKDWVLLCLYESSKEWLRLCICLAGQRSCETRHFWNLMTISAIGENKPSHSLWKDNTILCYNDL